jgi:hypothetical protein
MQKMHARRGSIWQADYMDRILKNEDDLQTAVNYVISNPWKRWPEIADYPFAAVEPVYYCAVETNQGLKRPVMHWL